MRRASGPLLSRRLTITLLASLILIAAGCVGSVLSPASPTSVPTPPPTQVSAPAPSPTPAPAAATPTATSAAAVATAVATASTAVPSFLGTEALQHLHVLADQIGARPSGSPATAQAAEYMESQLAALGYGARPQPYRLDAFRERSTQLRLRQPELLEIGARAFVYSGSGTVDGRLVDCGTGKSDDFRTAPIQGQIALVERGGTTSFTEKVLGAAARGGAAVIIFNDRPGELSGTLERPSPIPVVGILQYDGKRLQEMLRRGAVTLSLRTEVSTEPLQGSNVVASAKATPGRGKVVIGAHYDSIETPGANDNASGAATLLQLASTVRGKRYPFDLVFVAFGDEEVGLVGSRRYLESMQREERSRIMAMINLDMVGVGEAFEFSGDGDLVKRLMGISSKMGYAANESARMVNGSDQASFLERGIPAVFVHRAEDPYYHTPSDTADRIPASNLEAAGNVVLRLLSELNP